MLKVFAASKILSLATVVCLTGLLLGAGCPMTDVLNVGGNTTPTTTKPNPPTLQFTQPAARTDVQVGTVVGFIWTDTHPAGAATVRLYWDRDGDANTGDEVSIASQTEAAGATSGTYAWNTTGMAPGMYRVAATIDDHTNAPLTTYLAYEVVLRAKTSSTQQGVLSLLQPASQVNPRVGESVMIRWSVQNASPQTKLYLYYDTNLIPDDKTEQLIAAVSTGTGQVGSNDYGWTIPAGLQGTYYILGRLSDGTNPDVFAYAQGSVVVGSNSTADAERDLAEVGYQFAGAIFDGYQPYGRMGEVLTGGRDINGDTYSDFMLVAPKSWSPIMTTREAPLNRTGVGEAYLIYSRGISGRWPQRQTISVGTLGTYSLQGVKFIGPNFSTSTSGIQEVLFVDDRDGDGLSEIVFGIPDVNRLVEDQQDYDPLDDDQIHSAPPAPTGWLPGRYYNQFDGWQACSDTNDGLGPGNNPYDALRPAGYTDPATDPTPNPGKRSGEIIYVSSKSGMSNTIVLLDQVGGVVKWVNPLVSLASGMRIYPGATSDTTEWGSQMGTADLLGNLFPALLVARPMDANGSGSVKVMLQQMMVSVFNSWTTLPPALGTWFHVQPKCFSFPAADRTDQPANDYDRIPKWPSIGWYLFMDLVSVPPDPNHMDIMNSDPIVGGGGHLGHPTGLKDFNGDLTEDAAVSSPDASPMGLAQAGTAYIIYGNNGFQGADVNNFASLIVSGFELRGSQAGEQLGWKMVGPGDVDGDGHSDWVLTAPNRSWSGRSDCGAVVIVYGQPQLYGGNSIEDVVPILNGTIIYGAYAGDHLGTYMASVGDVDRDGYPDILVSAPNYSSPDRPFCGAVYLIFGGPHLVNGEFDIRDIGTPALPGKVYLGPEANAMVGPVGPAGDTDQDFYDDILIGYPGATPAKGLVQAGRAWLIYGSRRDAP